MVQINDMHYSLLFSGQNDIYEIGNAVINGETKCYDPCRYEEINMK